MITQKEWIHRHKLIFDALESAKQVSAAALDHHELDAYQELVTDAQDLMDEQYLPHYIGTANREEGRKLIVDTFQAVRCWELRRVLLRMEPKEALLLADTVCRMHNQKAFFRREQ
jgi:hypothetical protein